MINVPRQTKPSPIMHIRLLPYLSAKNPPGIDRNIAGRAINNINPAAAVWLKLKSSIIAGISGGAACMENRKAEAARTIVVSMSQRLLDIV